MYISKYVKIFYMYTGFRNKLKITKNKKSKIINMYITDLLTELLMNGIWVYFTHIVYYQLLAHRSHSDIIILTLLLKCLFFPFTPIQ